MAWRFIVPGWLIALLILGGIAAIVLVTAWSFAEDSLPRRLVRLVMELLS